MSDQKGTWIGVNEANVKLVFRCEEDNCPDPEEADVSPEIVADLGSPHCESCDHRMTYSHTKVKKA